jgi:trans-2-enoyl-CoA reductase
VENPRRETRQKPTVKYDIESIDIIVYSLAKAQWYGGNPSTIYNSPIDEVLLSYQYEIMTRDFEETDIAMNMEN